MMDKNSIAAALQCATEVESGAVISGPMAQ